MELISLDQVFRILRPGVPLPFGVRDAKGRLLLAKGLVVQEQGKLYDLLNRGMYVDVDEVERRPQAYGQSSTMPAPTERLSVRWEACLRKLGLLLRAPASPAFLDEVRDLAARMARMPESHTDQLIFLIVRHDYRQTERYVEAHSLHVATLCHLVSRRLGWTDSQRLSLIGAALTMNLGMVNLQAKLASQRTPPSPQQRAEIHAHPKVSVDLLRAAGLQDETWLRAVEQHHECPGGGGYPLQVQQPCELSQLIRFIDTFTAKHSVRAGRAKLAAHQAARDLYAQSGGNPLAAALIKECGIYPPGCYVKLASGEVAVVTRRGASAKEPLVAALTNGHGEPLTRPVQRDTAMPARAIVGTLPESAIMVHVTADQLYD